MDRILTDAINASPYTTPVQSRNTTLFAYEAALQQHLQFGAKSSSEEMDVMDPADIPPPVDIRRRNVQYQAVDKIRYKGRDLIILEHESDDEESVDDDESIDEAEIV